MILSAKYGLLSPNATVENYDLTLNGMPVTARREWAEHVFQDLVAFLSPGDRVIVLAGQRYGEFLIPRLRAYGVVVDRPLEGLRIGQQLSWLREQIR